MRRGRLKEPRSPGAGRIRAAFVNLASCGARLSAATSDEAEPRGGHWRAGRAQRWTETVAMSVRCLQTNAGRKEPEGADAARAGA